MKKNIKFIILNNESYYYNSNKKEKEKDIGSLYYEDSHNSEE